MIGYARVSTADQNLEMQTAALERHGIDPELIFTDKLSGAKKSRPGLEAALKAAQVDGCQLVVWKLDRLGRSLLGILDTVQAISDRDIRLVSLTEGLDLGTPMGRMVLHIMASLAEYERELIRERTTAGLREGRAHGRPVSMNDERCELAAKMLKEGKHIVNEILPVLQGIDGPSLNKSKLYAWVKDHKASLPADDDLSDK